MRLRVDFSLDNDAFAPNEIWEQFNAATVSYALAEVVSKVSQGDTSGQVRDGNGNTVGFFETYTEETLD